MDSSGYLSDPKPAETGNLPEESREAYSDSDLTSLSNMEPFSDVEGSLEASPEASSEELPGKTHAHKSPPQGASPGGEVALSTATLKDKTPTRAGPITEDTTPRQGQHASGDLGECTPLSAEQPALDGPARASEPGNPRPTELSSGNSRPTELSPGNSRPTELSPGNSRPTELSPGNSRPTELSHALHLGASEEPPQRAAAVASSREKEEMSAPALAPGTPAPGSATLTKPESAPTLAPTRRSSRTVKERNLDLEYTEQALRAPRPPKREKDDDDDDDVYDATLIPSYISTEPLSDFSSSDDEDYVSEPDKAGRPKIRPSYYYDAEYDPASAAGKKTASRSGGHKGVPVFEPTMADFAQCGGFYGYVQRIDKYGLRSGIAKVVPPREWTEALPSVLKPLSEVRLKEAITQHIEGSQGLYKVVNLTRSRIYNAQQWQELCLEERYATPDFRNAGELRGRRPPPASERAATRGGPPRESRRKRAASGTPQCEERGKRGVENGRAGPGAEETQTGEATTKPKSPEAGAEMAGKPKRPEVEAGEVAAAKDTVGSPLDESDPAADPATATASRAAPTPTPATTESTPDRPTKKPRTRNRKGAPHTTPMQKAEIDKGKWNEFVRTYKDQPGDMAVSDYDVATIRQIERDYWRKLTLGEPPAYGADMQGSLFTDKTKDWNVANLRDLLRKLAPTDCEIPGVVSPYLYFGMWRATFPWHVEDADLYSINYIHFGAPKFWYSVPQCDASRFERVMSGFFPVDRKQCPEFLRHKLFLASPRALSNSGITLNRCLQLPGEFILTFPKGYHSGFNLGFNCAESINFATERWLPYAKVTRPCVCVNFSVNIDIDVWLHQAAEREFDSPALARIEHQARRAAEARKRAKTDKSRTTPTAKAVSRSHPTKSAHAADRPNTSDFVCAFCPDAGTNDLMPVYGQTLKGEPMRVHRICALFTPTVWADVIDGVEYVMGFDNIEKDRWRLRCTLCNSTYGVKTQCTKGKCHTAVHVTCALLENSGVSISAEIAENGRWVNLLSSAAPNAAEVAIPASSANPAGAAGLAGLATSADVARSDPRPDPRSEPRLATHPEVPPEPPRLHQSLAASDSRPHSLTQSPAPNGDVFPTVLSRVNEALAALPGARPLTGAGASPKPVEGQKDLTSYAANLDPVKPLPKTALQPVPQPAQLYVPPSIPRPASASHLTLTPLVPAPLSPAHLSAPFSAAPLRPPPLIHRASHPLSQSNLAVLDACHMALSRSAVVQGQGFNGGQGGVEGVPSTGVGAAPQGLNAGQGGIVGFGGNQTTPQALAGTAHMASAPVVAPVPSAATMARPHPIPNIVYPTTPPPSVLPVNGTNGTNGTNVANSTNVANGSPLRAALASPVRPAPGSPIRPLNNSPTAITRVAPPGTPDGEIKLTVLCKTHNPEWKKLQLERRLAELTEKVGALSPGQVIWVKPSMYMTLSAPASVMKPPLFPSEAEKAGPQSSTVDKKDVAPYSEVGPNGGLLNTSGATTDATTAETNALSKEVDIPSAQNGLQTPQSAPVDSPALDAVPRASSTALTSVPPPPGTALPLSVSAHPLPTGAPPEPTTVMIAAQVEGAGAGSKALIKNETGSSSPKKPHGNSIDSGVVRARFVSNNPEKRMCNIEYVTETGHVYGHETIRWQQIIFDEEKVKKRQQALQKKMLAENIYVYF